MFGRGIGDMLSSRISVSEKIEVISPDALLTAMKRRVGEELAMADIYSLGEKLNADFVVWEALRKSATV